MAVAVINQAVTIRAVKLDRVFNEWLNNIPDELLKSVEAFGSIE
ncbi:MAG: hypothetical protein ACC657_16755 [Thiohalomonadales bacterium]